MISIRQRLVRKLLGTVLLILIGGLAALYFGAREVATDQFDRTVHAKALAISTLTFQTGDGFRFEFTDRFMRGFDDRKPTDYFQLWELNGREIARSESLPPRASLPRRVGKINRPADWNLTLPNGRPGRAIGFTFKPTAADPRARGPERELQLVVASDREELDETLWRLLALSGGWGLLLIGATLWAIPRVLRSGLQPLDALGEQAASIDADSLGTRFALAELPPELRPIAQRLNDLFGRLEQSFERERRFSSNLAHELRTPVAELRSIAECALKWPDARDASVDQDTLAIALQMERIVTHLVAMARGEQGGLVVKNEPVALAPLIRDIWQSLAARANARDLRILFELPPTTALADPALLRSILTNLFENAADYTPTGGSISIAIQRRAEQVAILIANTTHDLTAKDVPKLFDRFWRKDAARSGGTHLGLGLALSRSFAHAMGWTLTAALNDRRQIVFTLAGPSGAPGTQMAATASSEVTA